MARMAPGALSGRQRLHLHVRSGSAGAKYDVVKGADIAADWDVPATITGIDASIIAGAFSRCSTFNTDLACALDAAHMRVHHAVLFTPDGGMLSERDWWEGIPETNRKAACE